MTEWHMEKMILFSFICCDGSIRVKDVGFRFVCHVFPLHEVTSGCVSTGGFAAYMGESLQQVAALASTEQSIHTYTHYIRLLRNVIHRGKTPSVGRDKLALRYKY